MSNEQPRQLQVNISADALKALYSDVVFLNSNPFGLTLDFGQHLLAGQRVEIVTRVSLSPQHAKVLAGKLFEHVKQYEKQFGEIKITDKMKEMSEKNIGFKG